MSEDDRRLRVLGWVAMIAGGVLALGAKQRKEEERRSAALQAERKVCEDADELSTFCGRVFAIAVSDDGARIATASGCLGGARSSRCGTVEDTEFWLVLYQTVQPSSLTTSGWS